MNEEKETLWTDEQLQDKLLQSANEQPVPESLLPEQVVERLKAEQKEIYKKQKKKRSKYVLRFTEIAAAIALVAAVGGIGVRMLSARYASDNAADAAYSGSMAAESAAYDATAESADEDITLEGYQIASGYDEIYDLLMGDSGTSDNYYDADMGYVEEEDSVSDGSVAAGGSIASGNASTIMNGEVTMGASADVESQNKTADYSTTNVQQEGVDESDVVKTDGSYIYKLTSDSAIDIIDIQSGMKLASVITPDEAVVDTVSEMYVDGSRLYVIGSRTDASLDSSTDSDSVLYYYNNYKVTTVLLTYDITDRSNPKQIGIFSQDGSYDTSRKAGNYIYLFTRNYLYDSYYADVMDAIPCVQNVPVACSDIYLSNHAYTELLMTSVNTAQPETCVDLVMLLDDYSSVYMGNSSIYIYKYVYVNGQSMTQITEFSYEDGVLSPVASKLVRGLVTDTFAISEKDGTLRVLTSDQSSGERINRLYMLDEQLVQTGMIDDIAEGESIYAARYIGDLAYFITYRNMDPLFVADLSNPDDPVLLGSVEVSGFSDYLHLYEDDLVLGIGYETDENSYVEGVKLVMFDVSDPLDPQVKSSYVISDAANASDDSSYKSILVDAGKGIIGFITESWWEEYSCEYRLFTWTGEEFRELADLQISENGTYNRRAMDTRGLYAGDTFYLVADQKVTSFDMTQDFAKLDELNVSDK
jgi:uncharacterized secreted protein with C-terminal beta-propeller domain